MPVLLSFFITAATFTLGVRRTPSQTDSDFQKRGIWGGGAF